MAFLESLCKGKAHEVIFDLSCLANSKDAYSRAWSCLDARFGDTRKLMARLGEELLVGPPLRESDCDSLLELSDKMYQCEASFEGCEKSWMLNNQDFCIVFFNRLPYGVLLHKSKEGTGSKSKPFPSENSRLRQVCVAQQATKVKENEGNTTLKAHHPDKTRSVEVPCICCNEFHRLWKCSLFKSKTTTDRRKYAKNQSLCFNCLLVGHHASSCIVKITCRRCHRNDFLIIPYCTMIKNRFRILKTHLRIRAILKKLTLCVQHDLEIELMLLALSFLRLYLLMFGSRTLRSRSQRMPLLMRDQALTFVLKD